MSELKQPFLRAASIALLAVAMLPLSTPAQTVDGSRVTTRAQVTSIFREDGGRRTYIRLKLVPRAQLPFTTITFRVREPSLIDAIDEQSTVEFTAERIDGENTLKTIRKVAPCVRFQECPP